MTANPEAIQLLGWTRNKLSEQTGDPDAMARIGTAAACITSQQAGFYSARNACIGSVEAARVAGHQAANSPVSTNTPHVAARVNGP